MITKDKIKRKKKKIKIITSTSCWVCREKIPHIDYKDLDLLERFITPHGKLMSRRRGAVCALHQRRASRAIKVAQHMALIPFKVF
ncbi:MAG: 30S ribosomal protein S18 [Planctomycetota bacterium]